MWFGTVKTEKGKKREKLNFDSSLYLALSVQTVQNHMHLTALQSFGHQAMFLSKYPLYWDCPHKDAMRDGA